ncbi:MAG TPA: riboflavin biosynthesis protein RibF [Tepidisphaeraceae bacterium]|nr:riboflavin biosynthesis protein RibF [Tepidisphaeraceae bacterium]
MASTPPINITKGLQGLRSLPAGGVLSVGNFDGLHRGHRRILETGRELLAPGARLAVVTFEPHPLTVLRPDLAPPRLTPPQQKRELLAAVGVDDLVELPPNSDVLNLTAESFWAILRDEVRPTHMVEGKSFNFGKGRGGTIENLRDWSATSAVKLNIVDGVSVALLNLQVVEVSSSLIRWLTAHGRVRDAAICLGRSYALRGEVVKGHQRGRSIGVPTANLRVMDQLIPTDGVYVGRATIDGRTYAAAVSIGTMPTFGENQRQVEAHVIGFDGDLYGQTLEVELTDWIREQWKFAGIEALKSQMRRDIAYATERALLPIEHPIARIA